MTPHEPVNIPSALSVAVTLEQAGQVSQAEQIYRQILKNNPQNFDALYRFGGLAARLRRHAEAVDLFTRCAAVRPSEALALLPLGNAQAADGKPAEAIKTYRRALEINPDDAQLHAALGKALETSAPDAAIEAFQRACEIRADFVEAQQRLGAALKAQGRFESANLALFNAAVLSPGNSTLWQELITCLNESGRAQPFQQYFVSLWELEAVDTDALVRSVSRAVSQDPGFRTLTAQIRNLGPHSLRFLELSYFSGAAAQTVTQDLELEKVITGTRRALLKHVHDDMDRADLDTGSLALLCGIAQQCFLNDYLYVESEEERSWIAELRDHIAARKGVSSQSLAVLATFRPLYKESFAQTLGARRTPPGDGAIARLITTQVREPLAEKTAQATIAKLTPITDPVSRAVQSGYEENPYPRWTTVELGDPAPVEHVLTNLFPYLAGCSIKWPSSPRILISGCGSGRESISNSRRFTDASILAVDLSLPSLAYALRKASEYNALSVYFAQGDLLEMGGLEHRFDIIAANGVLHHLKDPYRGWEILCTLLVDGGLMRISLYSRIARRPVVSAKALATEQGFDASPESMRAFRSAIIALPADHPARSIVGSPDFYTLSGLRDFVFHVQEQHFTLPQIAEHLGELGLEFIGFEFADRALFDRYHRQFPDDANATSLEQWHQFELENPGTFENMYQFWVRQA